MTLPVTRLLAGRYQLEEVVGRGGMADVHRALDTVLEREVAVKLLRVPVVTDHDRARFRDEAQLLAGLEHPGLVAVLDAGLSDDDIPYLVMELVDGRTLVPFCRGAAVPPRQVAAIGVLLAQALAHVHERGIVHRDIKPGNVLVGDDGRVRLADFGIARMLGDTAGHTDTGTTVGTAAYLAPEQVRGEPVTAASDVYALGLVLLEALTGRPTYTGAPLQVALARLDVAPLIPASLPTGWPSLLTRMTAMDPADRPTAEQAAAPLADLARGASGEDRRA